MLRLLCAMRGLRGTPLDIFGRARLRRIERELIGEYRSTLEKALAGLTSTNYDQALRLPDFPRISADTRTSSWLASINTGNREQS